jgi:hypothetical protein
MKLGRARIEVVDAEAAVGAVYMAASKTISSVMMMSRLDFVDQSGLKIFDVERV